MDKTKVFYKIILKCVSSNRKNYIIKYYYFKTREHNVKWGSKDFTDYKYLNLGHENQIFLKANYNINIRAELKIYEMTIIKALSMKIQLRCDYLSYFQKYIYFAEVSTFDYQQC